MGKPHPTVLVTDVKETNFKHTFDLEYNKQAEKEFKLTVKPQYGRVFYSARCTEHKLDDFKFYEPFTGPVFDSSKCVKTVTYPYTVSTSREL